ncbi:hypothetical protein NECID01_0051 [Nematocida sp. AWRm77]|nr:hypothetical protein NECID01_0051 [Nematocida sp. AWRm77]
MLCSSKDAVTRAAVRLRKIEETGGKEVREIIESFSKTALEEMQITETHLFYTIGALFNCSSLHTTEKFIVLDVFYDLLRDLVGREEKIDLGDIPACLMRMKFLKNEKYVERAVVVYLQVILLLLKVVDTSEHKTGIFKIFCTLFMSKSFITSSRCGYLLPPLFKGFLVQHPEYIEKLLHNEDKLITCQPLLETVVSSHCRVDTVLSRLVVLDFLRRRNNELVLASLGKGFLDPFYFQMYIDKENASFQETFLMFSQPRFLEYLFLDVSLRVTSRKTLSRVIEKILLAGTRYLTRMIKDSPSVDECTYCVLSSELKDRLETKRQLETLLEEFNKTGNLAPIMQEIERMSKTDRQDPESPVADSVSVRTSWFLRAHPSTNLFMLGKYLGKEKNQEFLGEFCNSFDFRGSTLLSAIRVFLLSFNLPGEGQQIERIVYAFCKKYAEDENQNFDVCLSIAMSIIVLNTSIHNPNMVKKITPEEFISIIREHYPDVDVEYLQAVYESIKYKKLQVPTTNEPSDNIEFLSAQSEADSLLHKGYLPKQAYTYCDRCTRNVYFHVLDMFDIKKRAAASGQAADIKEFIKLCMHINARSIAYKTISHVSDPSLALHLVYAYKTEIQHVWQSFLIALIELSANKEEACGSTNSRFFGLFGFGKEQKKDRKEAFSEAVVEEILAETSKLPSEDIAQMVQCLLQTIETTKEKFLFRLSYILILKNTHRIHVFTPLLETLIEKAGISSKEMVSLLEKTSFAEFLSMAVHLHYKTSKHTPETVLALLHFIVQKFSDEKPPEECLEKTERWLISLARSEAFRLRTQKAVEDVWKGIEALAVCIDTLGHDSFEVFIRLKETLSMESKMQIIDNTSMYYKNVNRILLCLDLLQSNDNKEIEDRMLGMFGKLLQTDLESVSNILECCETILEKTSIYTTIENLIFDQIKTCPEQNSKYLQKIYNRMLDKSLPKNDIVDL